jgi:peptidyl-prolyl cis-trans isomerase SurA
MYKLKIFILLFFFQISDLVALEIKIISRIEKIIITNIDIKNEYRYLIATNKNIEDLKKEQILQIAKNSLINDSIKENEILKNFSDLEINQEYLESVIKMTFNRLGFDNLQDFKNYLEEYKTNYEYIKKKIKVETLWNQIIFQKYSEKIAIDQDQIKKKIESEIEENEYFKNYLISELIFKAKNNDEIKEKYEEIKKSINVNGFEKTVLLFSVGDSKKKNGAIGWLRETEMSDIIKSEIASINVNQFTKPITIPGAFLILYINEIKDEKSDINLEEELQKAINREKNRKLSQYSQIYFNKVKKNTFINE